MLYMRIFALIGLLVLLCIRVSVFPIISPFNFLNDILVFFFWFFDFVVFGLLFFGFVSALFLPSNYIAHLKLLF